MITRATQPGRRTAHVNLIDVLDFITDCVMALIIHCVLALAGVALLYWLVGATGDWPVIGGWGR